MRELGREKVRDPRFAVRILAPRLRRIKVAHKAIDGYDVDIYSTAVGRSIDLEEPVAFNDLV